MSGVDGSGALPEVSLFNRQRAVPLDLNTIETVVRRSQSSCLQSRGPGRAPLSDLPEVEVSLVSDRVIAQLHRQFLNVRGATDVITFGHGEIVVSASTAARQARLLGETVEREVVRYIVHGLLHLNGHEDAQPDDAAAMWKSQEAILQQVWPVESPEISRQRPGIASKR